MDATVGIMYQQNMMANQKDKKVLSYINNFILTDSRSIFSVPVEVPPTEISPEIGET